MTDARNARHQLRALTNRFPSNTVVDARQQLRVLRQPNARNARQQLRVLIESPPPAARDARQQLRVLVELPVVTVKVWNGSAFVDAPLRVHNGTSFVNVVAVKTWNGTGFV